MFLKIPQYSQENTCVEVSTLNVKDRKKMISAPIVKSISIENN